GRRRRGLCGHVAVDRQRLRIACSGARDGIGADRIAPHRGSSGILVKLVCTCQTPKLSFNGAYLGGCKRLRKGAPMAVGESVPNLPLPRLFLRLTCLPKLAKIRGLCKRLTLLRDVSPRPGFCVGVIFMTVSPVVLMDWRGCLRSLCGR